MTDQQFPTADEVPFPFSTPYRQQLDLMDTFLRGLKVRGEGALDNPKGAVMMLESPTGTGKSLSLACAAVTWLRYVEKVDLGEATEKKLTEQTQHHSPVAEAEEDWLDSWVAPHQREEQDRRQRTKQKATEARRELETQLSLIRQKLVGDDDRKQERRENLVRSAVTVATVEERKKNRTMKRRVKPKLQLEAEDYCVQDYRSDSSDFTNGGCDHDGSDEEETSSWKSGTKTTKVASLLDGRALDGSCLGHAHSVGGVLPGTGTRKIIYAARTHSQLSQFVGELSRTHWGANVRVAALGGRKNLCGNSAMHGKPESVISEYCLDLQKGTTSKKRSATGCGCPLMASRAAISALAMNMLSQPTDIEEAARLGTASQTCAYYASRESLAAAEVVVLPYNMLLSKQTRSAIGLSLKEALVIVDEAHNLPEAIRALHSCRLSLPVVEIALEQLSAYVQKYVDRLASRNLQYIGQIRKMLVAFSHHLKKPEAHHSSMMSAGEFLVDLKLDTVNIFKILLYLKQSRLPQKLLGFTNIATGNLGNGKTTTNTEEQVLSKHVSALSLVQSFLEKLALKSDHGKIITDTPCQESRLRTSHPTLRYALLEPSAYFEDVVSEAHTVALVGGTLRPFVHVAAELLSDQPVIRQAANADKHLSIVSPVSRSFVSQEFTAFTCDHVVPPSHVMLQCLDFGPANRKLDFRFKSRNSNDVCDELGQTLLYLCSIVPSGVVVFLPSFSYEAHLVRRWKLTGVLDKLKCKKRLYREPKSSARVENVLDSYSRYAKEGALLLSVVGGKMSEGINFSNEMARCVVVAGLPYPDIKDPEMKEKMTCMDRSHSNGAGISGSAYYHNLCMRALNQSVGRAIRHARDYAAIVLADCRYKTDERIWFGLPEWLQRSAPADWRHDVPFVARMAQLESFFDARAKRN